MEPRYKCVNYDGLRRSRDIFFIENLRPKIIVLFDRLRRSRGINVFID